jgi:hypothetical protein
MNTTANAFIYGATQSIGDTAIAATLTAARWGVMGWEWYCATFFSPAATRRYRLIGEILGHCMILAIIGWRMAQQWAASEVSAALPGAAPEVDPFCPSINPLPVAQPTFTPALIGATLASLRKQCIAYNATLPQGDTRRIARAARLTKAEAIAALRMAS